MFGAGVQQQPQQKPGGLFANLPQNSQHGQSQFAQSLPQPAAQPVLQLGQSQQGGQPGTPQGQQGLWQEGRGLGVYRTIPEQMALINLKWRSETLQSPLRTYLYQVVDENSVPFFQPNLTDPNIPLDDETKWEEAVSKRPGPNYIPSLVRGFWELGKRAQRQREYIEKCNIRLHDINASLDAQIEIHSQRITTRMAECRRKHIVASQRTLALAAKIQILRNRGYVMDNAEEELSIKLKQLEREIFDPSLNGRGQEIWARMLGIRERGRRLKTEMEKAAPVAKKEDVTLDEETVQSAKKALEAYDTQLRHLQKELELVQQEYADWEKTSGGQTTGGR